VVSIFTVLILVYVLLVLQRFTVSVVGVGIIFTAFFAACGTMFFSNMEITAFTTEVIPYLILTLGLDNVFIICNAEKQIPSYVHKVETRIALTMKEVGPPIFISSVSQVAAFFVGIATDVPALRNVCIVGGLALFYLFIFQMTIFLGVFTYDL
jgi:Niemann-Pick C1 protein